LSSAIQLHSSKRAHEQVQRASYREFGRKGCLKKVEANVVMLKEVASLLMGQRSDEYRLSELDFSQQCGVK